MLLNIVFYKCWMKRANWLSVWIYLARRLISKCYIDCCVYFIRSCLGNNLLRKYLWKLEIFLERLISLSISHTFWFLSWMRKFIDLSSVLIKIFRILFDCFFKFGSTKINQKFYKIHDYIILDNYKITLLGRTIFFIDDGDRY